jgi:hypothetical protein
VAYVTGVNGGNVTVHEQSCCEGSSCWPNCSWCINGFQDATDSAGYFDGGYITTKGAVNPCGDGACNNGENCSSCPGDCGPCEWCGDGKCNNGENCSSCSQDCGGCCPNGACDNGENCSTCPNDCGQCCGNGACDFGETCGSCDKDCGICNEAPEGDLEVANCQQLVGWARDLDVESPIGVDVRADGNSIAQMTADQAVSSHPGFGFSMPLGPELKDGGLHTFEVIGNDDKGLANSPLAGSGKQVLCRNGTSTVGIWTMLYQDAAGVDVAPVPGEGGWTDLRLFHAEGLSYPTSGVVTAAADISESPFVRVTADLCGGLVSPLYLAAIGVGGDSLGELPSGPSPCLPVEYLASGKSMSASLLATGMEYDASGREVVLRNLSFWSRGWRFGYSWDSEGMSWRSDAVDRVAFESRPEAASCRGFVAAARQFAFPFQGVELRGTPGSGGPEMVVVAGDAEPVDLDECLATGPCTITGKEGVADRLVLRADCGEGAVLDGPFERALEHIRVFRDFVDEVPPWTITGTRVWGMVPDFPQVSPHGLSLRISTHDADFVPTGAIAGEVTLPAPQAEEFRGMLSYSLPAQCYHGFLTVDGAPVESLQSGETKAPFRIERVGSTFGMAMTAKDGCDGDDVDGFVAVENLSYLRDGWWTTPSTMHQGIRDSREDGCSLVFENLKWVGMEGNKAFGSLLVHKFLGETHTGIRVKVSHTFEGPFFKLELLLDGKPVKDFALQSPGSREAELTGRDFGEVGLRFSVAVSDVFPFKWRADVYAIEVYREGSGWRSICEVAVAEPELEGVARGDEVTGGTGGDTWEPSERRTSGCAAGTTGTPAWTALLLLVGLCAGIRVWNRQSRLRSR